MGFKVTIVEFLGSIGGLGIDLEIVKTMLWILQKQRLKFKFDTKVTNTIENADGTVSVNIEPSKPQQMNYNVLLIYISHRLYTKDLSLEKVNIQLDYKSWIPVNRRLQTFIPNIYAIGDVIERPILVHKAEDEGII